MGFLSSFFGGDQRKDIRRANAEANSALKTGYDAATGRYGEAFDMLTPYEQQGRAANDAYGAALGLGTDEERAALQQSYESDSGFQGLLGLQSNAMLRKLNAGGSGTGGGKLALAGARVGQAAYGDYLNRLMGEGERGGQYATGHASIKQGQGDLDWSFGTTKAGQAVNYGNAMSASRNIGINNLLGVAGLGLKAAKLF